MDTVVVVVVLGIRLSRAIRRKVGMVDIPRSSSRGMEVDTPRSSRGMDMERARSMEAGMASSRRRRNMG